MANANDETVPHRGSWGLPVRTLRVAVIAGPNKGTTQVADSDTLTIGSAQGNDLLLTDETVSGFHLELLACPDGVRVVDHGSTNGTTVGTARIERAMIPAGTVLTLGRTQLRVDDGDRVEVALHGGDSLSGLRGRTPVMRRVMARIERAARSDAAVLLLGESGTGKELVARALAENSPRAKGPFITVDCASLSPTLVASELFGHERGAFTGANERHIGAFERADGGTIFLDEIGELPAGLQPALLGVLERRHFRRLGGKQEVSVDVRVVSATHRDLRAEVNNGTFRLDLYYRIAVVHLQIPPLRDRLEDVPVLVEHFLREAGCDGPVEQYVSAATMSMLCKHHWSGNVRELRNLVEATVAMGETPALESGASQGRMTADEEPTLEGNQDILAPLLNLTYKEARSQLLTQFEVRYLSRLIGQSSGNVSKAARQARMDRSHLTDLLRRHGLK